MNRGSPGLRDGAGSGDAPGPTGRTGPGTRPGSPRGARTRQQLLDAAERLWGERGVHGASLREIRIAAGQRNSSALQFHFGDRDGLLHALAQRHMPRVAALQEELHAAHVDRGRADDLDAMVEILIRPDAEYLRRGPSERAWIRLSAELFASPEITLDDVTTHAPPLAVDLGTRVYERLSRTVAPDVAIERLLSVLVATRHLCADRARLEAVTSETTTPEAPAAPVATTPDRGAAEAPGATVDPRRGALPFDRWLDNLLDMAVAALRAPHRTAHDEGRSDGTEG